MENCIITNTSGLNIPVRWNTTAKLPAAGTGVQLRFYFRDATIYALGAGAP